MHAHRTMPAPPAADGHSFVVGQDGRGCWLAVETHGLGGGLFVSRDAALHYARDETMRRPGGIILTDEPVSLLPGYGAPGAATGPFTTNR